MRRKVARFTKGKELPKPMRVWLLLASFWLVGSLLAPGVLGQRAKPSMAPEQPLVLQLFGRAAGLPSDYVSDVVQDGSGYLWFATDQGISRYDGRSFRNLLVDDGLPGNLVYCLYPGSEQRLWVGTFDHGAAYYDGQKFTQFLPEEGFPLRSVNKICEDTLGNVFLAGADGIATWREGMEMPTLLVKSGVGFAGGDVVRLDGGAVIGKAGEDLILLTGSKWGGIYPVPLPLILPSSYGGCTGLPIRLFALAGDRFAVFNGEEVLIFKYNGGQAVFEEAVKTTWTEAFIEAGNERLFATRNEGLVVASKTEAGTQTYGTAQGLPVNYLTGMLRDYEGNIWISTFGGGVARILSREMRWIHKPQGLTGSQVSALYQDSRKRLWVGTDQGYNLLEGDRLSVASTNNAPGFTARSFTEMLPGEYLLGSFGGVQFAADEGGIRGNRWAPVADIPAGISSMVQNGDGSVWVSSYGQGIFKLRRGERPKGFYPPALAFKKGWQVDTALTQRTGLASDLVEQLIRTRSGLWIIHNSGGVGRLAGDSLVYIDKWLGLPASTVTTVYEDATGTIYLGTQKGLVRLRNGVFEALGAGEVDGMGRIRAIFEMRQNGDKAPRLWVLSDRFLYMQDTRTEELKFQRLGSFILLPEKDMSINRVLIDSTARRLYLGTTRGVVIHELGSYKGSYVPPRVRINAMKLDQVPINMALPDLRLDYGEQDLTFEVAGLSFIGNGELKFRYKLQGLESDFSEPTTERSITYRNVPDGTYSFQVEAINADGLVSASPAFLTFGIRPPLHKRTWARVVFVLLLLAGVAGVVRYFSIRKLMVRIRDLELQRKLDSERQRISRDLHDNVGAQLTSILSGLEFSERLGVPEGSRLLELVRALKQDTRTTIGQLRETIWAMAKGTITLEAFAEQLDQYTRRQLQYFGPMHFEIQKVGMLDVVLSPAQALNLFRILQEGIQNALKHAQATTLTVVFERPERDQLVVTLSDNGKGLPPGLLTSPEGHYGLVNMQRRAEELGGTFNLYSPTTGGTRLVVGLPIQVLAQE